MNFQLSDEMVAAMDDTADYMHQPASRDSAFFWRGTPSVVTPQLRPHKMDRSTEARRYCYPVEGQAAGEASFHRRQAIRLGGI